MYIAPPYLWAMDESNLERVMFVLFPLTYMIPPSSALLFVKFDDTTLVSSPSMYMIPPWYALLWLKLDRIILVLFPLMNIVPPLPVGELTVFIANVEFDMSVLTPSI